MIERHVSFYMGSRIFAAAVNLASVAVFARLAGPERYGEYLVAFAWAYVVHGFAVQWIRFSFFALYDPDRVNEQISTTIAMLVVSLLLIVLGATALVATGAVSVSIITAAGCLAVALGIYDSAHEIGRTRLLAGSVAATVISRAVLTLAFGVIALKLYHSMLALAVAVALAHLMATLPLLRHILPHLDSAQSLKQARAYVDYGWPLSLSFGVTSLGQNADRLLLEHWAGALAVGPYGAVSDLIRQSMVVVSEAIAGAYIAIAKSAAASGDDARAREVLSHAFRAYTAVAAFGSAFILRFERLIIDTLLGESFRAPVESLVPFFVVTSVLIIFRSFYFGQVIFFARTSRPDLTASIVLVVVVAVLSWLLIPRHGAMGAVIAALTGQIVSMGVYYFASRHLYAMPIPWRDVAGICGLALAAYGVTGLTAFSGTPAWAQVLLNGSLLVASFMLAARIYNLLELNHIMAKLIGRSGLMPRKMP